MTYTEPRTITYQVTYWSPIDLALRSRNQNPSTRTGSFTVVAPMTRDAAVDAWELINPGCQILAFVPQQPEAQ